MYRNLSRGSRVLQQHRHRLVQQQQQRFHGYEQSTDTATTLMKCVGAMAVGGAVLVTVQPKGASNQASEQLPVARGDNELGNADIRSKIEADLEAQKKPTEEEEEVVVVEEPVEIVVEEVEEPVVVEEAAPVEEVVEVEAPVEEPEPVVVEEVAEVAVEAVEAVAEVVEELAEEVAEVAEAVAEAIEAEVEAVQAVAEAVEAAIEEVGLVAVEVVEEVEAVVETVVEEVAEVEAVVEAAVEAVVEEVAAVEATVDEVVEAAVEEVAAVEAAVETVVEEVVEVADAVEVVAEEVAATVEAVVEETVEVAETIADVVAEVVEVVAEAKDEVVEAVEEVVETVEVAVDVAIEEVSVVVEEVAQVEAAVEAVVEAVVEEVAVVEAAVETVVDEAVELAQAVEAAVAEVVAVADEVLEVVAEPAAVAPVAEATIDAEITTVQDGVNQIAAEVEAAAAAEAESVNAIGGVGVVVVAEAEALVEAAPVVAEEILPEQVAQVVVIEDEELVAIVDSVIESEPVVAVEEAVIEEVAPVEAVPVVEEAETVVEAVAEEVAPVEEAAPVVADEAVIPVEAPIEEVVEEEVVAAVAIAYPEIPPEMPYVIIGGGTAAYAAVRAIRKYEPSAKILILSKEVQAPYNRTPLSKEMWFTTPDKSGQAKYENWKGKEVSLYHEKEDFYCTTKELQAREDYGGTALLLNATVDKLDANEKKVILTNGAEIKFDKALIAVGGQPRSLPVFDEAGEGVNAKVTKFRTVADFWKLERLSREKPGDIVVVGSGFLGTELAYALGERAKSMDGLKVTQVCRESGVLGAVLPLHLSNYASAELEKNNVTVVRDAQIAKVALAEDDKMRLELVDGRHIDADHAVLAVGVDVDNALAQRSGLEHDPARGGFIVNSELESRRDIFVAGDAANFYDIRLGRRRVEHYDHAIVTGRLAGENMTGKRKAYSHQSMFWSDIGPDIGFEAIGLVDSRLKSVSVFTDQSAGGDVLNDSALSDKKYDRGVVFYTRNDTVVGVVTWNIFNKMGIARRLIAMEQHQPDYAELAKLFDVNKL